MLLYDNGAISSFVVFIAINIKRRGCGRGGGYFNVGIVLTGCKTGVGVSRCSCPM